MRLDRTHQLIDIAAFPPKRKELDLLFTGEALQVGVVFEKPMEGALEGCGVNSFRNSTTSNGSLRRQLSANREFRNNAGSYSSVGST